MRNLVYLVPILLLLTNCKPSYISKGTIFTTEDFRGLWKLHGIEILDTTMQKWQEHPRFVGREGYILYDGIGGMGVQHLPASYSDYQLEGKYPEDSLSQNDLKHIASGFVYFGNYTLDPVHNIIEHHIKTDMRPNYWNTVAKRSFEFHGDTLMLKPINRAVPIRIVWIRSGSNPNQ